MGEASAGPLPPEVEAMVQQVTAVMPQVPYTAIRKDLSKHHFFKLDGQLPLSINFLFLFFLPTVSTHSVDQTITNILEGRVKYTPIPTLHEATSVRSGAGDSVMSKSQVSQSLFGGNKSRSAHLSQQRQMSLDDRKKLLFEQARRQVLLLNCSVQLGIDNLCLGQGPQHIMTNELAKIIAFVCNVLPVRVCLFTFTNHVRIIGLDS